MGKAKDDFNPHLRQAILGVVDNQLRENNPPETRETLARLIKEGKAYPLDSTSPKI